MATDLDGPENRPDQKKGNEAKASPVDESYQDLRIFEPLTPGRNRIDFWIFIHEEDLSKCDPHGHEE